MEPEVKNTAPKLLPNVPERKAGSLRREILELRRLIRRLKKDDRTAKKDVVKRGASIVEARLDSNGNATPRTVPNPSLRISREIRNTIKGYKTDLILLEKQFEQACRKAEAESSGNRFDF